MSVSPEKRYLSPPDELAQINDLAKGYLESERKLLDAAERAIGNSRVFVIQQLLTYMLEDKSRNLKVLD